MNWYKKAHMYSADEDHGDGEGVFGHPDDHVTDRRNIKKSKRRVSNHLNDEINAFLSPNGKTEYFGHVPISDIFDIVDSEGMTPIDEDGSRWQGMLVGEEGRTTIELQDVDDAFSLNLHIQWYKMESGKFEVTAYVN